MYFDEKQVSNFLQREWKRDMQKDSEIASGAAVIHLQHASFMSLFHLIWEVCHS